MTTPTPSHRHMAISLTAVAVMVAVAVSPTHAEPPVLPSVAERTLTLTADAPGQEWTVHSTPGTVVGSSSLVVRNIDTQPLTGLGVWPAGYHSDADTLIAAVAPAEWPPSRRVQALYEFARDRYYQWEPPSTWTLEGERAAHFFNAYGYGLCSDIAAALGQLFSRAGYPTRIWNIGTPRSHVVTEVFYDGRWHMYDANWPVAFHLTDGMTVASVEDLVTTPAILDEAGPAYAPLRPIYASTTLDAFTHFAPHGALPNVPSTWTLLPGEEIRYSTTSGVTPRDDNPGPPNPAYSIASGRLKVTLDAAQLAGHARIDSMSNAIVRERAGVPAWEPKSPAQPGDLLVRVALPYPIRELTATVQGRTIGANAQVSLGVLRHADAFVLADSDLASGAFRTWPGVVHADGLSSAELDDVFPLLHLADGGTPAALVVQLHGTASERRLQASLFRQSLADQLAIDWSPDGLSWEPLWSAGDAEVGYFDIALPLPSAVPVMYLRTAMAAGPPGHPGTVGMRRLLVTGMRSPLPEPAWHSPGTTFDVVGRESVALGSVVAPRRGLAAHGFLLHVRLEAPDGELARLEALELDVAFQTSRWSPARLEIGTTAFSLALNHPGRVGVEHEWTEVAASVPGVPTGLLPTGGTLPPDAPTLSWEAVPGAIGYDVRLCLDAACLTPVSFDHVQPAEDSGQPGRVAWMPGPASIPTLGRVYHWSVRAVGSTYVSGWAETAFFGLGRRPDLTVNPPPSTTLDTPWTSISGTLDGPGIASLSWRSNRGQGGEIPVGPSWTFPLTLEAGTTDLTIEATGEAGLKTTRHLRLSVAPRPYFLAEGATGTFFDTRVVIANHYDLAAPVRLRVMGDGGTIHEKELLVAPRSRVDVDLEARVGDETRGVATEVLSLRAVPLVVERLMTWGKDQDGAHAVAARGLTSRSWYFAEGSQGFFDTYWLVVNPQPQPIVVQARFLLDDGDPVSEDVPVGPHGRATLFAGAVPGLVGRSFAAVFDAPEPVVVERAMYFGRGDEWVGGHASPGVTAPGTRWFFAEGATGEFFDTFLLLANPNPQPVTTTIIYYTAIGEVLTRTHVLPRFSRKTVWVNADPQLAVAEMSVVVEASAPVVAERAMYWPFSASQWEDAHVVLGGRASGTRWGVADVRTGGTASYDTYLLIANTARQPTTVRVTFQGDGGDPVSRTVDIAPASRFTMSTAIMFPELRDRSISALVDVLDGPEVYVESAMYWNAGGRIWAGGVSRPATPLPTPPE